MSKLPATTSTISRFRVALHVGRADESRPRQSDCGYGRGRNALAFGMLWRPARTSAVRPGQIVDAAMVEGSHFLPVGLCTTRAARGATGGANLLDTGAHFYEVYETKDGGFIAVGAIEPQFYAALLRGWL